MGISIKAKTDYSSLFSSMNSSNSSSRYSMLTDYASIKNGSYGKLMKAYYTKDGASKQVSSLVKSDKNLRSYSTSEDTAKKITEIERSAESLQKSSNTLLEEEFKENEESLLKMKDFVSNYNTMIDKTEDSSVSSISTKMDTLLSITKGNENSLKELGITIGDDGKLSLSEDTYKSADLATAKKLFNGNGSYGYSVAAQASLIDYQANYEGIKANTYTNNGSFTGSSSVGSLFDSTY